MVGVLCLREITLGKGTLRTYPSSRVPTGSPAALVINNDAIGGEEQTDDSYYSQRRFKLLIE